MAENSTNPFVEAFQAGLSPIPVDTSTKRPLVRWAQFQEAPAELLVLQEWAGCNIGIVCGAVSGRLICIDVEGGFLEGHGLPELAKRLKIGEVYDLWWSWMEGYCESTPSGGLHILIRLQGNGPTEGNTKLANDPDGKVLIETRGEGGYVIVAPSRNGEHGWELLRGGLASIAYATLDEWAAVAAVLSSFDVAGKPAPPLPQTGTQAGCVSLVPTLRLGESWINDELARLGPMAEILQAHGWSQARSHDDYGQHWTRPGKELREGHSASVSENDRLYVHSSNAGLSVGNPTHDVLDVILFYALGHRPSLDERTEYLRAQRHPAGVALAASPEPSRVAEPSVRIPDEVWNARSWLSKLRDVAQRRMLAPDGVLGAFLSCYAATVPMGIWVPGVVARRAPLNIYSCLVAKSGGGKTGAMGVALDLLGWNVNNNPHVLLNQSLRSGEGLPRLVVIPAKRGSDEGPTFNNAVQISFDEGGTLGKQSERAGSTIIPYLNTAWAGSGTVGGAKATEVVQFPAEFVRICAVMGVQYGAAANLFTGESAALGFPQRLIYFGMVDESLASFDVDTMDDSPVESVDVTFWDHSEFSRQPLYMSVPEHVKRQVRLWTRDKDHGTGGVEPLDGHMMNSRLRVASIFSLLEGRGGLNDEDWLLGSAVLDTSRRIRQQLISSLGELSLQRTKARIDEAVLTADALEERWLRKRAARIARFVHSQSEGCTLKDLKTRLDPTERRRRTEIIDRAQQLDWITEVEGRYFGGGSRPA